MPRALVRYGAAQFARTLSREYAADRNKGRRRSMPVAPVTALAPGVLEWGLMLYGAGVTRVALPDAVRATCTGTCGKTCRELAGMPHPGAGGGVASPS